MAVSTETAVDLRSAVQDLDMSKQEDLDTYKAKRKEFIGPNESLHPDTGDLKVYKDSKGHDSVGYGFNMDRKGAKAEWDKAFETLPENDRPDFDKVRGGDKITAAQSTTLFNHSADLREEQLGKLYGQKAWDKLKPNEKLAVLDMYYNADNKLVGVNPVKDKDGKNKKDKDGNTITQPTHFYTNMQGYISSQNNNLGVNNPAPLNDTLWEVQNNSVSKSERDDPNTGPGLQNRRDAEAEMLNSNSQRLTTLPKPSYIKEKSKDGDKRSELDNGQGANMVAKIDNMIGQWKKDGLKTEEINGFASRDNGASGVVKSADNVAVQTVATLAQTQQNSRA